jgi:hypothetical protein
LMLRLPMKLPQRKKRPKNNYCDFGESALADSLFVYKKE